MRRKLSAVMSAVVLATCAQPSAAQDATTATPTPSPPTAAPDDSLVLLSVDVRTMPDQVTRSADPPAPQWRTTFGSERRSEPGQSEAIHIRRRGHRPVAGCDGRADPAPLVSRRTMAPRRVAPNSCDQCGSERKRNRRRPRPCSDNGSGRAPAPRTARDGPGSPAGAFRRVGPRASGGDGRRHSRSRFHRRPPDLGCLRTPARRLRQRLPWPHRP